MGINVIKKRIIMPLLLVCSHPFLFGMVSFMVVMYRYCPPLFGFLVSSSPVVGCTFLFLWIILNSSQYEPEEDQEKKRYNSLIGIGNKHLPSKVNVDGDFVERRDVLFNGSSRNLFLNDGHDGGKNDVTVFDASSSKNEKNKVIEAEKGKEVQGAPRAGRALYDMSKINQNGRSTLTNNDGRSNDSLEDPILDELYPLLESEPTESASMSNSDSLSIEKSLISDDDGSEAEDTEIQEEEEEEGEIQEDKNDEAEETVLQWTADDEKNVRDVRNSELERNQTLEQLIAKRKYRSFLRSETEKNLIYFDNSEPTAAVQELSRLLIHIPPRKNPFDIPDEAEGVIPGSAPSVLLPRKNPFDLPSPGDLLSSSNEDAAGKSSHQDFPVFQLRDAVLRRNETFALGVSPADQRHEKRPTRFQPYFVAERMDTDELSYARLDTQLSGISGSMASSVVETESVSSDSVPSNHEIYKDTLDQDQDVLQQRCLASPSYSDALSADHERCSSEVELVVEEVVVVIEEEEEEIQEQEDDHYDDEGGSTEIDQDHHEDINVDSLSEFNEIVTNGITDDSITEVVKRHWMNVRSRMSYAMKRMMAEENLDESNTSSDTDSDDESSSHDSAASVIADSEMISHPDLDAHEHQIIGPVYDSSPSAMEISISNVNSIEEALLYLSKDGLKSCSSLASNMQVEVSESGSPPSLIGHNLYPGEEPSSSGHWVASALLSFVDQHESRTRELREIKEHDVIKVDFTGMDDFHDSPGVSLPMSAPETNEIELSLPSSVEVNLIEVNEVKKERGFSFDSMKNVVTPPLSLSKLVCGDDLASSTSFIPQPLPDNLIPPSPPSKFIIADSRISILPPILEDILEESKHEDDQDTLGPFKEDHNASKDRSMPVDFEVPEGNLNSTPSNLQVTNGTSLLGAEVYLPGYGTEAVNFSDEHEDFR